MSLTKVSDFKPLIVIDVGTDTTKFSQSDLNTFTVSNIIRNKLQEMKFDPKELELKISNNTVFEVDKLKYDDEEQIESDSKMHKAIFKAKGFSKLMKKKQEENKNNKNEKAEESDDSLDEEKIRKFNQNNNETNTNNNRKVVDSEQLYSINPNTIFDSDYFVDTFPTIISSIKSTTGGKDSQLHFAKHFNYNEVGNIINNLNISDNEKLNLSFLWDFHGEKANYSIDSSYWEFETMHSGLIRNFENWSNIMDIVGQTKLTSQNFYSNLFTETPIVLTQNCLKFEQLQKQTKLQYEILFETYKCPYVLICSQGLVNLYSNNMSSGVVVDIGESGTSITTAVNGFTQYDNSLYLPFFSGRNVTALMALQSKAKNSDDFNINNTSSIFNQYNLNYKEYLEMKFIKESTFSQCYIPGKALENKYTPIFNRKENFYEHSTCPYLFFYPEVFKTVISKQNIRSYLKQEKTKNNFERYLDSMSFVSNFQSLIDFIINDNKPFYFMERNKFNIYVQSTFNEKNIMRYE